MNTEPKESIQAGDDVMKSIGRLEHATDEYKRNSSEPGGPTQEEAANFIGLVIRAVLKVFGK